MKDKDITNVIHVENPSLNQELWKDTSVSNAMLFKKNATNVIIVEIPSLH